MLEAVVVAIQQTAEELRAEVRLPDVLPLLPGDVQVASSASLAEPPVVSFPASASAAGAREGAVSLACIVSESGVARKCIAESEQPAGFGFAAEALEAAPTFRFNPRMLNGTPLESVVRFRIVFQPEQQETAGESW